MSSAQAMENRRRSVRQKELVNARQRLTTASREFAEILNQVGGLLVHGHSAIQATYAYADMSVARYRAALVRAFKKRKHLDSQLLVPKWNPPNFKPTPPYDGMASQVPLSVLLAAPIVELVEAARRCLLDQEVASPDGPHIGHTPDIGGGGEPQTGGPPNAVPDDGSREGSGTSAAA
jgi:hypothetical protein